MKTVKWLLALIVVAGVIISSWYFRPWSDFSPARVAALTDPTRYAENFRNMAALIPARRVSNERSVRELEGSSRPLALDYSFRGETKSLDEFLSESATTSLLVIKDGVIHHQQYLNGANEESLFTSWSVAKSFVATVVLMALNEGKIESLDDPVSKYAPQYAGSDFGKVSLNALLAMSSGIEFEENYAADNSDIRAFFFDSFIFGKDPDELLKAFKQSRPEFTDFDYISANSHVLSAVARGVYQQPLADIISEKIWRPLGMEGDANWLQHREGEAGQALGYCCLNARTRDYGRFGLFYLEAYQGRGLGADLLPLSLVSQLHQPASDHHLPGGDRYGGRGYSYHFWLPASNPNVFMAVGIYGQYIWIDPLRNLVIVKTSADPEFLGRVRETTEVLESIAGEFDG